MNSALIVFLALCTVSVSAQAQIVAYEGDTVIFDCGHFRDCFYFHWRRGENLKLLIIDNGIITQYSRDIKLLTAYPPMASFLVRNVSSAGMYRCYCETNDGQEYIHQFTLEVHRLFPQDKSTVIPHHHEEKMEVYPKCFDQEAGMMMAALIIVTLGCGIIIALKCTYVFRYSKV
ncbi:ORF56 [Duck adenovirus 3]|uniref:ORF56 n=3 Tax=Duck aviadenovirus B TaxID=1534553 RepID=A0A5F2P0F6_9ADEN|nr:ORF56 [Duck adenovirus 2]AYH52303.1 ORF56 [Duck adenovirus 3]QKX94126.1 ORF56 [Duck aviadenovirus B]AYH52333.1 ORF56 [Duck adenovirus 3]QNN30780.1 ORF56 [Duck adenovirus 2]